MNVRYWHFADIYTGSENVRFWGYSGHAAFLRLLVCAD